MKVDILSLKTAEMARYGDDANIYIGTNFCGKLPTNLQP